MKIIASRTSCFQRPSCVQKLKQLQGGHPWYQTSCMNGPIPFLHKQIGPHMGKSAILCPAAILCPKIKTVERCSSMVSNILYERPHPISTKMDKPTHMQVGHLVSSGHLVSKS